MRKKLPNLKSLIPNKLASIKFFDKLSALFFTLFSPVFKYNFLIYNA